MQDLLNNINDAMIIKSIIYLGNNLGFNVIAEGIETEEQLQFLITNKCLEGQGLYLNEPKNATQLTEFLEMEKS